MCGILGIVGTNSLSYKETFIKSLKTLRHRGKDDLNFVCEKNYIVGYTRLAIQGDASCNQPIKSSDWLAFGNGENYSHTKDYNDLYDIANSITEFNGSVFEKYDADFAVSIIKDNTTLFLARDRFGVKPLFYSWINKELLVFSSEINAILSFVKNLPNSDALVDYLLFGYPLGNKTVFKNIYSFPQKSIFKWNFINGEKDIKMFDFEVKGYEKTKDIVDFDYVLSKSVKLRTIGLRKIGAHLSGGLDSTMINYLLAKNIKNYTAYTAYISKEDSDLITANKVAKELNIFSKVTKVPKRKNYKRLTSILSSPIMSSGAFVPYLNAKTACKDKIKVIIEGQGSDELLLGYYRFKNVPHNMSNKQFIDLLINSDIQTLREIFLNCDFDITNEKSRSMLDVQKFYIYNFMHELLKIEDHVNMHYEIENRVPYLSMFVEQYIKDNLFLSNVNKAPLYNLHKKYNTVVPINKDKTNLNSSIANELKYQKRNFKKLLKKYLVIDLEEQKILHKLKNLDALNKKELFSLWAVYCVLVWSDIYKFNDKIKLDFKHWSFNNERLFKFE